jgi:hypothetical protein
LSQYEYEKAINGPELKPTFVACSVLTFFVAYKGTTLRELAFPNGVEYRAKESFCLSERLTKKLKKGPLDKNMYLFTLNPIQAPKFHEKI